MDVNYGNQIKQYLLDKVKLLHIHRFDPDEVQFNDASDSMFSTFEDHSITYTLAALDLESDSLSYSLVQQAVKGTVSLNEKTGILIYTPFPDVNGMDAFNVIADDGMMQSAVAHDGQSDSEPAMISIHVRNVNDLPIALWDIIEVHADSSVIGQLKASDVDYQDTLTFKLLESTTKGQLQLNETTGMFSYWAYETASGLDDLKFLVNDGTVDSNIAGA
ncbi:MAG: hypothetical protein OMM_03972 [Candidatus Magnetoglobus multicellularis str. Araruama]|uniref:RapA2 cadherin-like domain-containing protein n=1 Tax=Candidatus Magnetoglobus multicellularis str. Araruama TaxID=890399 RepID=A0A1V1P3I1_9BACT|nr:MAG: hypothetical protein OMM_03972 [Candidatus Magnetoglobus multicellularis str. Araruama]